MTKRRPSRRRPDPSAPPSEAATDRDRRFRLYRRARVRRFVTSVLVDTVKGVAVAVLLALIALVLYRMGLVALGQSLEPNLLDPLSWFGSVRDLLINLSQFNEWMLLGLAAASAIAAAVLAWRWRRAQVKRDPSSPIRSPILLRLERIARSTRPVVMVATWAAIFLGAWLYQQYLWRVELPVPPGVLGVAFTREAGASVSLADLRGQLTLRGHSDAVALRELPVRLDPGDIDRGRALANRIGAKALVIFRQEADPSSGSSTFVAYVRFADPGYGLEVPLPERASDGTLTGIAYRTANGLEVPRLATGDTTRLVEATAGIVLYDAGDYLSAIAHLTAALPPAGEPDEMESVVQFRSRIREHPAWARRRGSDRVRGGDRRLDAARVAKPPGPADAWFRAQHPGGWHVRGRSRGCRAAPACGSGHRQGDHRGPRACRGSRGLSSRPRRTRRDLPRSAADLQTTRKRRRCGRRQRWRRLACWSMQWMTDVLDSGALAPASSPETAGSDGVMRSNSRSRIRAIRPRRRS